MSSEKTNIYQRGSTGPEVQKIQLRLQELGYFNQAKDGVFGPAVEAAVRAFKSENQLPADGIVDQVTWQRLFRVRQDEMAARDFQYLDFELEIGKSGSTEPEKEFTVQVRSANVFKPYPVAFNMKRGIIDHLTPLTPYSMAAMKEFGKELFRTIFSGPVGDLYHLSRDAATARKRGLRIKLRLMSPELHALPWELLYDPFREEYPSLSRDTSIIRLPIGPTDRLPLKVELPLRMLAMAASASDPGEIDLRREREKIEAATKEAQSRGLIELTWVPGQTWRDLKQAMEGGSWNIFHFTGYGSFDLPASEGDFNLANEQDLMKMISADHLAKLQSDPYALRLVMLASCETAKTSGHHVFSRPAGIVALHDIQAVVAMQSMVTEQSAINFAATFYNAIASGLPVDTAVTEARKAVFMASRTMSKMLDWASPVLFMTSSDGRIFEMEANNEVAVQQEAQNVPPPPLVEPDPVEVTSKTDSERPQHNPSPETPPQETPRIWLAAASRKKVDWKESFSKELIIFEGTKGAAAKENMLQAQRGDIVLAYQASSDDPGIVGFGVVERITGQRLATGPKLTIRLLYGSGVKLNQLKAAVPSLHISSRPIAFMPVTEEEWAVIRSLILYNDQNIGPDKLPKANVPPRASLSILRIWTSQYMYPNKPFSIDLDLKNTGNTILERGIPFHIISHWRIAGAIKTIDTSIRDWPAYTPDNIPPGSMFISEFKENILTKPGQYEIKLEVQGEGWQNESRSGSFTLNITVSDSGWTEGANPESPQAATLPVAGQSPPVSDYAGESSPPSSTPPPTEALPPSPINFTPAQDVDQGSPAIVREPERDEPSPQIDSASQVARSQATLNPTLSTESQSTPVPAAAPIPIVSNFTINLQRYEPPSIENKVEVEVNAETVRLTFGKNRYSSRCLIRQNAEALLENEFLPKEYGELLFNSIINDHLSGDAGIGNSTLRGYAFAKSEAAGKLRFELHLDPASLNDPAIPALHSYKWEYLKDPTDNVPVALYEGSPFYRLHGNTNKEPAKTHRLKILVAICNPSDLGSGNNKYITDLGKLDVPQERAIIEMGLQRLRDAGVADYKIMGGEEGPAVTFQRLSQELEEGYHVLHILAHGIFVDELKEYWLVMEKEDRQHDFVKAEDFSGPLVGGQLRLVVLAACQSGNYKTGSLFQGLGPRLTDAGVPAVIAMQALAPLDFAQFFTQHFYDDLVRSGRVDMAMAATRYAIYQSFGADRSNWGIPILLMSASEGRLFDIDEQQVGRQLAELRPQIMQADQLPGGDPVERRLKHALETAALASGLSQETLTALRFSFPGITSAQSDRPPVTRQDRVAITNQIKNAVRINAGDLKDYVERKNVYADVSGGGLELPDLVYSQVASALNTGKHLILIGPPGTGKTSLAHEICNYARTRKYTPGVMATTATADWTSFDTVGGYAPVQQQALEFRLGIFLRAICHAEWLIIDEINRAEIDKAFGELFTVLSGQPVDLPYWVGDEQVRVRPAARKDLNDWIPEALAGGYDYVIHPNWRILASMNVYDKSYLFAMSFAFMRRFAFVDIDLPAQERYHALLNHWMDQSNLSQETRGGMSGKLFELLEIEKPLRRRRALGPAILKDIIAYIGDRHTHANGRDLVDLLCEALLLHAIPQLDGLDRDGITDIYQFIDGLFTESEMRRDILTRISLLYPHIREWHDR